MSAPAAGAGGPSQRELLRARGIRPQKRRGQNFLVDGNMARAIAADVLALGDHVLELGAGAGALTLPLLEAGARVTAVEVDRKLCALLDEELGGRPGFVLVEGDIARLDWADLARRAGPRPVLAGNLPYVLTSEVLFALAGLRAETAGAVFMVQKEVAARLTAEPGGKEYGVLAVLLGSLYTVSLLRTVPAAVFWPQPEVVSAVVRLTPRPEPWPEEEFMRFKEVVKTLFNVRRKKLGRILRLRWGLDEAAAAAALAAAGLDPADRPEQAPREALRRLAALLPEAAS